ncbi:MAG TPA: DUF1073 domain-containing protein [Leptospiraceae bacterium]|nr:DUF1073 domain-containing protein [Leptospiraceae bacterium]HMW08576.1 DUF1073 domain-containing protein [Leptospiraceae bacterium]HMZ66481.1 DUF1073 domain-containing protein [Leptospiraceae bacterium]HNA10023.1 DUF1073 domain-containing protein [Leptospiraceae bacterium]HNC00258.1 DUF1073 domain-containing protein [Leptospiraceae bacterium]
MKKKLAKRYDSFTDEMTGRGTKKDKLSQITANPTSYHPVDLRKFYQANGFIQNIVDGPADDATREWITIKTNRDDIKINRIIENRLLELKARAKIRELIRYMRMYNQGGILYYGVKCLVPQTDTQLTEPIQTPIQSLDFINVIPPDRFNIYCDLYDPLARGYGKSRIHINGIEIHPTRYSWLVNSLIPEEHNGISVIQTILDAILAQDTALWSVNSLIYELAVTVFKSKEVPNMKPAEVEEFLTTMKAVMSSQSAIALGSDEDLTKKTLSIPGVKELFEFIFDNLAGMAKMPKSRLMGQAQGTELLHI